MNFIMDGGALFMVPLLILLAVIILLFTKGLKNGVLGFVIGMLGALDDIAEIGGDIAPQVLAGGFKVGLLSPTFGMVIFLIGKLFTIILTSMKK